VRTFKVGDKVRIVRVRPDDEATFSVGDVGVIAVANRGGLYNHRVRFENGSTDLVHDDEIEPLAEDDAHES
jgi:hypothetical protein